MEAHCGKCGKLKEPILVETGQTISGYSELKICDCEVNEDV